MNSTELGARVKEDAVTRQVGAQRGSQTDAAVAELRSRIIDLTLLPGSRIDEPLLLEQFRLGRTPAREALNRLAAEGFVIIQPGRGGTFVRPLDLDEIGDILGARQLAESILSQRCRLDDESLADDLSAIHAEYALQVRDRNYLLITEINERFHMRLHRTVGNSFFYDFAESTHRHNRRLNVYLYKLESNVAAQHLWEFENDLQEHDAIVHAVAARDRDLLQSLLNEHADGTQRRLVQLLRQRTLEDGTAPAFVDLGS
ncbi:GntR family transcriptional regulator [Paenarthrobacter sp. RAF54_2]|uniref:GntR family transcriptional regulator n=1 Tax=Paenarthrobacter sp. RAF54_2 TaxID=3233061 RepID=UPI003F9DBC6A